MWQEIYNSLNKEAQSFIDMWEHAVSIVYGPAGDRVSNEVMDVIRQAAAGEGFAAWNKWNLNQRRLYFLLNGHDFDACENLVCATWQEEPLAA